MAGGRWRDTGDTTLKSWAKEGVLYPLYLNKGMCGPCDNNLSGSGLMISESSAHHDLHPCGQDPVKETGYCHLRGKHEHLREPLAPPSVMVLLLFYPALGYVGHQLRTQSWQAPSKWPLGRVPRTSSELWLQTLGRDWASWALLPSGIGGGDRVSR